MSENSIATEEANEMIGVNFIDLEEIMDASEEEPQDLDELENLSRRLCEAENSYREKKEIHDRLYEHGLDTEEMMNEMEAENKYLASKVKELQQQLKDIRKKKEEDEEALSQKLLSEEQSQVIHRWKVEKEIKQLKEENEDLTAQLEQLSLGPNRKEQIHELCTAQQQLKLEQVQEVMRSKDEETEKESAILIQRKNEIEEYFDTTENLRQDYQDLQEQLSRRRENQILASSSASSITTKTSTNKQPQDEEHMDERPLTNEKFWWCLKSLWKGAKVAGHIALAVVLVVGVVTTMASECNSPDPDCIVWNNVFSLLEQYRQLYCTNLTLY